MQNLDAFRPDYLHLVRADRTHAVILDSPTFSNNDGFGLARKYSSAAKRTHHGAGESRQRAGGLCRTGGGAPLGTE